MGSLGAGNGEEIVDKKQARCEDNACQGTEWAMSNYLNHHCGGEWEPIFGWSSRYKCSKCQAVGYRNAAAPRGTGYRGKVFVGEKEYIKEYVCQVKGCKAYAVSTRKKSRYCSKHKDLRTQVRG